MTGPHPRYGSAAPATDDRLDSAPAAEEVLDAICGQAIITLDRDGTITSWNEGARRLTGYAGEDVRGRSFDIVSAGELAGEMEDALEAADSTGLFTRERWWRCRDADLVYVGEQIQPFQDSGYIVVARDLAERAPAGDRHDARAADRGSTDSALRIGLQVAERRAAFLAEASSILVATSLDSESTLRALARLAVSRLSDWCAIHALDATGAFARAQIAHRDTDLELPLEQLLDQGLNDRWRDAVRSVARTGRSRIQFDLQPSTWFNPDGAVEPDLVARLGTGSAMITPLIGHGLVLGAITFVSTDPKREYDQDDLALAEELARRAAIALDNARLYAEAQEANRAKADFLAVVSHELRTPLNAIMGYTDLLDAGVSGDLTDKQRHQLDRIRASARHLLQLIDEILSFARMEAGRDEASFKPVAASEIVNGAAVIIEPLAAAKGLRFETDVQDDVTIETDVDKARQILINVLSNSVKFTDQGTITLTVRHNDEFVHFDVIDTGIGIPRNQLDRIFDPFWQVERPNVRRAGGTGLGLSVSRRFARLLQGEIAVQSEPGRGTRITISLPLRRDASEDGTDGDAAAAD